MTSSLFNESHDGNATTSGSTAVQQMQMPTGVGAAVFVVAVFIVVLMICACYGSRLCRPPPTPTGYEAPASMAPAGEASVVVAGEASGVVAGARGAERGAADGVDDTTGRGGDLPPDTADTADGGSTGDETSDADSCATPERSLV